MSLMPRLNRNKQKFLMESREQGNPGWVRTNKELEEKVRAGEDDPFPQLGKRNPEFLKTDLVIARIIDYKELLA